MKKALKKIHLWLSVPFGIFITLICFSGAMMVFETEITELCRHDLYFVKEVKEKPLPMELLVEKASASLPDSVSVTGVTVSSDPERAWQLSLSKPRRASIYVDQYTGEVKGRGERLPFYDTMFHLHRWMLGSAQSKDGGMSIGKLTVGVSTLALVVILVTGILMWLTNRKKPLKRSLTISFTKGRHRFWHDLHVAGGIYAAIFLLAIALTGLTWSFSWYRTGFYAMFGAEASDGGGHGDNGARNRDNSGRHGDNGGERSFKGNDRKPGSRGNGHRHGRQEGEEGHKASPYVHWQDVFDKLAHDNPGYRQITISDGSASVVPKGRMSLRAGDRFDFEPQSGRITGSTPYEKQDKSVKVRSCVYMLHVGSWGGIITRVIAFLAALLGVALPLTGYYLWLKRLRGKCTKNKVL